MAEEQRIVYAKPKFIEEAQVNLIKALEDYIKDAPILPDRQFVGLSPTQIDAITRLQSGIGAFDPNILSALQATQEAQTLAKTPVDDFVKRGEARIADAISTDFDPDSFKPFLSRSQQFIIDEINKQAEQAKTKAADVARQRGAFGGSRDAIAEGQIEEARLKAIGSSTAKAADDAMKLALASFQQEEKEKLAGAQLAPYFTSAQSKADQSGILSLLKAAGLEGNLATAGSKLGLQDVSALLGAGKLVQSEAEKAAEIERQNILQAQNQPLQLYSMFANILSGLPEQQGTQFTQTVGTPTTAFQDLLGTAATIAGGSGKIFSKDGSNLSKGIMALKHGRS
tara:strand:- start:232 stop:1251 length:1020 start_codon:yes stop_codon:yes gene_type:complete